MDNSLHFILERNMSFTKKKKRQNNTETTAAAAAASGSNENNIKECLASNSLANDHQQGSSGSNTGNGCTRNGGGDNNNKENTALGNGFGPGNTRASIESGEIVSNNQQSNNLVVGKQQWPHATTTTKDSHLAPKRRFVVLARLFKPWKWRRKKKTDKNNSKGIFISPMLAVLFMNCDQAKPCSWPM